MKNKKDILQILNCSEEDLEKVLDALGFKNKTEFTLNEVKKIKRKYKEMFATPTLSTLSTLPTIPTQSSSPRNDGPDLGY